MQARWGLIACAWYLTQFASEVCIGPFVNVFMRLQGLTKEQIGVISAIRPWLGVPASFIWSAAADYFHIHRPLMVCLFTAAVAVRVFLPFASTFGPLLAIMLVNQCLGSPVFVMADTAVTKSCTEEGEYGTYRLWGAIGWGGMSTLAGLVWEAYGIKAALALSLALAVPCIVLSWFLWQPKPRLMFTKAKDSFARLDSRRVSVDEVLEMAHLTAESPSDSPGQSPVSARPDEAKHYFRPDGVNGEHAGVSLQKGAEPAEGAELQQPSFSAKLLRIFSRAESLVFFWTATLMGFGMGMIDAYLFLLLRDLGAADWLLGFTLTVTCLAEAPVFRIQGYMLRKLGSPDALLDVAVGAYCIRMVLYAALPELGSPWYIVPVELLHGLTFGCGWGAGCEKSKALAPPGLEATQQGIFQGLYFGLGTGLGSLVGGIIAERHGFQVMFLLGSVVMAAGWVLALLGRRLTASNGIPYLPVMRAES